MGRLMPTKAFIVLAHECSTNLIKLLQTLLSDDSYVALHYDANSGALPKKIADLCEHNPKLLIVERVPVVWGEWSIVEATINAIKALKSSGVAFSYVSLLSGACTLIKPLSMLDDYLLQHSGQQFIESVDAEDFRWVIDGYQVERWRFFHWCNWRTSPRTFDFSMKLQKLFHINRRLPAGMSPRMGSQWWTLSWDLLCKIVNFTDSNKLQHFFSNTWIPDELFFQTLAYHLCEDKTKICHPLMHVSFNTAGIPRVFYNDDIPELLTAGAFFARKISAEASQLLEKMTLVSRSSTNTFIETLTSAVSSLSESERKIPSLEATHLQFVHSAISFKREMQLVQTAAKPSYFVVISSSSDHKLNQWIVAANTNNGVLCHGRLLHNAISVCRNSFTFDNCSAEKPSELEVEKYRKNHSVLKKHLKVGVGLPGLMVNILKDRLAKGMLNAFLTDPDCLVILDLDFSSEATLNDTTKWIVDTLHPINASASQILEQAQLQLLERQAWASWMPLVQQIAAGFNDSDGCTGLVLSTASPKDFADALKPFIQPYVPAKA